MSIGPLYRLEQKSCGCQTYPGTDVHQRSRDFQLHSERSAYPGHPLQECL